jgi:hypothetical protein
MAIGESPSRIAGEAPRVDSRTDFRALAGRDITVPIGDRQYFRDLLIRHFLHSTKKEDVSVMDWQIVDGALYQLGIRAIFRSVLL